MRFAQTESDLAQWLRGRRSNTPLMALMAHQIPLILLFLLPQTFKMADPSCSLDKYTVWHPLIKFGAGPSIGTGGNCHIW